MLDRAKLTVDIDGAIHETVHYVCTRTKNAGIRRWQVRDRVTDRRIGLGSDDELEAVGLLLQAEEQFVENQMRDLDLHLLAQKQHAEREEQRTQQALEQRRYDYEDREAERRERLHLAADDQIAYALDLIRAELRAMSAGQVSGFIHAVKSSRPAVERAKGIAVPYLRAVAAKQTADEAPGRLVEAIRAALDAGMTPAVLAHVLGMSEDEMNARIEPADSPAIGDQPD